VKPSARSVLALLRAHPRGITAMDALGAGCGDRLAARIGEVKAAGHRIADSWEMTPTGARVKRYRLVHPTPAEVHASHVRLGFRSGSCDLCPIQLTMLDPAIGAAPVPLSGRGTDQRAERFAQSSGGG